MPTAGTNWINRIIGKNPIPIRKLKCCEVRLITSLIRDACTYAISNEKFTASTGVEDCISNIIVEHIKKRSSNGPLRLLISKVSKEHNYNYNGTKRVTADISITFTNPSFYNLPIQFEAKIFKAPNKNTDFTEMSKYLEDGMRRYVDEEYSWWTRDAFMIAYVRNGTTLTDFKKYLTTKGSNNHSPHYKKINNCNFVNNIPNLNIKSRILASSEHDRNNTPLNQTQPPGPIVLWHVFMNFDTKVSCTCKNDNLCQCSRFHSQQINLEGIC